MAVNIRNETQISNIKYMKADYQSGRWGAYIASFFLLVTLLLPGCAIVRPGEVGVKVTLGKIKDKIHQKRAFKEIYFQ